APAAAAAREVQVRAAGPATDDAGGFEIKGVDVLRFAALSAELELRPREAVLAAHRLDEAALGRVREGFRRLFAAHPSLERELAVLVAHARRRLSVVDASSRRASPAPAADPPRTPTPAAVTARASSPERTVELRAGGEGITLPFRRVEPLPKGAGLPRLSPLAPKPPASDADATVSIADAPRAPATPFESPSREETLFAPDAPPAGPALPFQPGDSPLRAAASAPRAAHDGATVEARSEPPVDPLPFKAPAGEAEEPSVTLTLEQHASLAAELGAKGADVAVILARYKLTPEQKTAVDAHYASLTGRDPEARARWREAFRVWATYLKTRQG
ncbi:MAG TPA: hypothetical protein VHB21_08390, partial [Minicystis sp.]|nr:hypothetical protein [Minicystis sp.]